MKILVVGSKISPYTNDGPSEVTGKLLLGLLKNNVGVVFMGENLSENIQQQVYKDYQGILGVYSYTLGNLGDIILVQLKTLFLGMQIYKKHQDIDVIHFQNYPGGKYLILFCWFKFIGKKLMFTAHDQIMKELKYDNWGKKIVRISHRILTLPLFILTDGVVVFSDFMYQFICKYITSKRVYKMHVPVGNEFNMINSKPLKIQDKHFDSLKIFAYGSHNKKKGFEYLVKELYILKKKGIKFICKIGGKGQLTLKLIALINTLNLNQEVEFVGFLNSNQLQECFHWCDIIAHTPDYEGYGIAILESLFSGKLVFATKLGGQMDFQKDFQNLILFCKEIGSLSDLIYKIDRDLVRTYQISPTSISKYSLNEMAIKYITAYKAII